MGLGAGSEELGPSAAVGSSCIAPRHPVDTKGAQDRLRCGPSTEIKTLWWLTRWTGRVGHGEDRS